MLLLDGQVHHDTHAVPMGNYVIAVGNYVIVSPSELGNYMSADTEHEKTAKHPARLDTDRVTVLMPQTGSSPKSTL